MTFLIATLWVLPIILILAILVYSHLFIISIFIKLLLILKKSLTKEITISCLESIKNIFIEDLFFTKQKYRNRSILKIGIGLFFVVNFLLFVYFYNNYINNETKHHKAKSYYVVGMVPHTYSVALGNLITPLYPALLGLNVPIRKMKEILFKKGMDYIPKDDAERELWEYEWFYYPYVGNSYDMWGEYVRKDNLGGDIHAQKNHYIYFKHKLDYLYTLMDAINKKSMNDETLSIDSKLSFGHMARYYFMNEKYLAPYEELNRDTLASFPKFLKKDNTLLERRENIKEWLFKTKDALEKMPKFQENVVENQKKLLLNKAILDSTLLLYLEVSIIADIHKNSFSCDNKTILDYQKIRRNFLEDSTLTKLLDLGYQEDWFRIYSVTVKNTQSEFIRQLLNQECQIDVPGHSREVSNGRDMLDVNSSIYRDTLKEYYKNNRNEINDNETQINYTSQEIIVIDNLEYQNTQFKERTWYEAKEYCSELNLYGTGWRLPNIDELEKIASVKMGKVEEQPANWRDENYPKNANPVKREKKWYLFLKTEFIKTLSDFSLMPNIWTSEVIWHPQFIKNYAYRMEFWMGGTSLTSKDRKFTTTALCVRAKNN